MKPSSTLPPRALQFVGLGGLIIQLVYWMATGHRDPVMLTPFGALATFGLGLEALRSGKGE